MQRFDHLRSARGLTGLILVCLLAALLPAARPARAATPISVELESVADVRVQGGSPDAGFGGGFLWVGTPNGHLAYVQFDLLAVPADATISSAELRMAFQGQYDGAANVELGRNDSAWDEATVTWNTRPGSTFSGLTRPVGDDPATITWDVTGVVRQWHGGAPNYGFALRGDGVLKAFHSRETAQPPVLAITYTVPDGGGQRPDLGDAPDSTNSRGVSPNSAYGGVAGDFPTVWAGTPPGEPAGPRHANPSFEGILGVALSREQEADSGNDADGVNNILDGGADTADADRGDDGWRSRSLPLHNCEPTTLRVRVSKGPSAQLSHMFLNVWFDGDHDGRWGSRQLCTPDGEALQIPAHEWIVQDYYVDMSGIPAGGYVDIDVPTVTVLNTTPDQRHWVRFTLSEERAPRSPNGRADGRGPHPDAGSYRFGETEDVLHSPPRPGEDGTLELSKRVVTDGEPVEWIDYVSYEIRLRHVGGTQAVQARISDVLPYPLIVYPTIDGGNIRYIVVTSPGGATPLSAQLEVIPPSGGAPPRQAIEWQGTLAPDSEVLLTFQVRVLALCEPNQQTMTFVNHAEARPRAGAPVVAEDSFDAKCLSYEEEDITFTEVAIENPIDLEDLTTVTWSAELWNRRDAPVRIGLYTPGATLITQDNTTDVELGPGERRTVRLSLPLGQGGDPLEQIGDPRPIPVGFCFLPPEGNSCPDPARHPSYHGEAPPATPTPRSNDLGDAPDSTNHAGAAMAAYPGVPASFATVFDPATGAAQGPRHLTPRPFHLGERVSLEAEADVGPDQDPLNNLVPAANDPDNDRADDGARLSNLAHCQPATAEVKLFISPAALAWFQQQGAPAYLNAWVDGNRDGDWADGVGCGGGPDGGGPPAIEHILIDQPIDVAALGAGLHSLSFSTGRVPWPAAQAEKPAWARFTLGEQPANKTLQYGPIQYGDGRGYAAPFRTGETEDYLLRAQGGADLAVSLRGRIIPGASADGGDQVSFSITYANLGDRPASGGSLAFARPEQLRDPEIRMLRAPGVPPASITVTDEAVTVALPDLAPGAERALLLGWELPPGQPPAGDYLAEVTAALAGDPEPENNQARLSLAPPAAPLLLAVEAGDGSAWGLAETTCRDFIRFPGQSALNVLYDFWIDGAVDHAMIASVSPWTHAHADMPEGDHEIWFAPNPQTSPPQQSNTVRLNVDTSLPVDPLTLTFTDSQGRSYHPPTLSWGRLKREVAAHLRAGEAYTVEITSCLEDPNQQVELALPGGDTITMTDAEGDGRYTGAFIYSPGGAVSAAEGALGSSPAAAASSDLRLRVRGGGAEQSFAVAVTPLAPGFARDASSGQPLAGVSVAALAPGPGGAALPAAATGGQGAQTTGADGGYGFVTMGGAFRLLATRAGYQPYRTWDTPAAGGVLAPEIRLTPEIGGAPDHTVYLTADGFVPAELRAVPGSLVEWVNLDQSEHGVSGAGGDSGALAPGQSYRARLSGAGSLTFTDPASPASSGTIIVDDGGQRVFLPMLRR